MDLAELNASLSKAIETNNHRLQTALRLKWATEETARQQAEVEELRASASLEEQDVARLKEGGLLGLWYDLIGRRADLLTKEEEEAALARLRLAEAEERLRQVEGERSALQAELEAMGETARIVEQLMEEKRRLIQANHPELAERLLALEAEERRLEGVQVRLTHVKTAGARATDALARMEEALRAAQELGSRDLGTHGNVFHDYAKYSRLGDANRWARKVKEALADFQQDLPNLDLARHIPTLKIDARTELTDMLSNSRLADRAVFGRITDGLGRLKLVQGELQMLMEQFEREDAQAAKDREMTRFKREMLLTSFT